MSNQLHPHGQWIFVFSAALLLSPTISFAQERHGTPAAMEHQQHGGGARNQQDDRGQRGERGVEMQRQPFGYQRLQRPHEIDMRPKTFDADRYHHNFRAAQNYRIGPYHARPGFEYRRWRYGDILPAEFWGPDYLLTDYWLFGLDMPPVGYEWVRYGNDGLMINLATGEIVQSVYDIFH
ncbi:RcnB family protein [Stenotrophomonas sp. YIM B06876]|uniref:RcnB family protein n=1 Tax=Stenotrophomonas sp. YIM B06876 TaxID=3060211 RepID=UPI00273922DC|nr:RcnB family protein [Stenotrophomonas sp. YIM B06876]